MRAIRIKTGVSTRLELALFAKNHKLPISETLECMTTTDETYDIKYQLDCGRWVTVEECYISTSALGVLVGSKERIRRHLIENLPEKVKRQFAQLQEEEFLYIKPMPEKLPNFVFMVYLVSEPISDPESHGSKLIVCWLSDDITTSLPELIKQETRAIEWNKYAVDFKF